MAEKIERIVTIPLRAEWLKKARDDRTKRSIATIRDYAYRHTKAEEVIISRMINEVIWDRGIQKPPGKIKVKIIVSEGTARIMLPDEKEGLEAKEKKGAAAALKDKITGAPKADAPKAETPKEELSKEAKPAEKAVEKPVEKPATVEKNSEKKK